VIEPDSAEKLMERDYVVRVHRYDAASSEVPAGKASSRKCEQCWENTTPTPMPIQRTCGVTLLPISGSGPSDLKGAVGPWCGFWSIP